MSYPPLSSTVSRVSRIVVQCMDEILRSQMSLKSSDYYPCYSRDVLFILRLCLSALYFGLFKLCFINNQPDCELCKDFPIFLGAWAQINIYVFRGFSSYNIVMVFYCQLLFGLRLVSVCCLGYLNGSTPF